MVTGAVHVNHVILGVLVYPVGAFCLVVLEINNVFNLFKPFDQLVHIQVLINL